MAKKFATKKTYMRVYKYPTRVNNYGNTLCEEKVNRITAWGVKIDYKTGEFSFEGISGRINRNGGIISLHIDNVNDDFHYLMVNRFRGRDYRTAIPQIMDWIDDYRINVEYSNCND